MNRTQSDVELIEALRRRAGHEHIPLSVRALLSAAAGRLDELLPRDPVAICCHYGHTQRAHNCFSCENTFKPLV